MLKSSIELLVKNQKVFFKKGPAVAIGGIVYGPLQEAHPAGNVFPIANETVSTGASAPKPAFFVPSKNWVNAVKTTIEKEYKNCPTLRSMAQFQKEGYLNINDQRSGVWGRVSDPSDIMGTCLLKNGDMVPETFQEMPTHILYSKTEGLSTLTPYLHDQMLKELAKSNQKNEGDLEL